MELRLRASEKASVRILRSFLGLLWFSAWFFVAFPAALLWLRGIPWLPEPGLARSLGFAIAGIALAGVVVESLRLALRGRGTPLPFDPPTQLVAEGPYLYVRNPMYLLYVGIAVGESIAYRSAWLAGYAAFFFGLVHLYVVKLEEPRLHERFGESYADYCQRVSRWLPRRSLPLDVRESVSTTRNSRGTL